MKDLLVNNMYKGVKYGKVELNPNTYGRLRGGSLGRYIICVMLSPPLGRMYLQRDAGDLPIARILE